MDWKHEKGRDPRARVDLAGGWFICACDDKGDFPGPDDVANVAIYDAGGEDGDDGKAYFSFATFRLADAVLNSLVIDGMGPAAIAATLRALDTVAPRRNDPDPIVQRCRACKALRRGHLCKASRFGESRCWHCDTCEGVQEYF